MSAAIEPPPLLETSVSAIVDGQLVYRGIPVQDILEHADFATTAWLLWHGALPTPAEHATLESSLAAAWELPRDLIARLRALPPATPPFVVLREAIATVELAAARQPAVPSGDLPLTDPARLLGMLPNVAALWHHIAAGRPHFAPRVEGSLAARLLHAIRGEAASDAEARALDRALILYADYGLTASTLAARIAAAAQASLPTTLIAALCVVSGPLHGGVLDQVARFLAGIPAPNEAPRVVEPLLRLGQLPPGFTATPDPRALLFRRLAATPGRGPWLKVADTVADITYRHTGDTPTADLYAAVLLNGLGIPRDLAPVVFALGRTAGWIAHALEQQADNRLAPPTARYIGPSLTAWPTRRPRP